VLIIGILAAIALPQYQKAVLKSKASAVFPLLKAVTDAQERHMLATGSYADEFGQLDIQLSNDCSGNLCTLGNNVWRISNGFVLVYFDTDTVGVNFFTIARVFNAAAAPSDPVKNGQILCYGREDAIGSDRFKKVCESFSPSSSFSISSGKIWILN
ncbi:MAG: hypothetical protein LBL61_00040, partial [Elusimicrobiota bacterium]|nr:hypothetical protein [Elusimicrobiota bacterium]